jgi:hypothetical protein
MFFGHPIIATDVKPLEPLHGGWREDPQFAAIKEDGLDYRLIEPGKGKRRCILASENLPDAGPGGAGVVVVLGQETAQVLEYFDPLQHISVDRELLP